jgi:hypothetical protein
MGGEETTFEGWAILELMGHRRLAGYVQEATIAGGAFVRIDVPRALLPDEVAVGAPAETAATQFYAPAAVYCITPTSEGTARAVAARSRPTPVQRWELEPAPDDVPF